MERIEISKTINTVISKTLIDSSNEFKEILEILKKTFTKEQKTEYDFLNNYEIKISKLLMIIIGLNIGLFIIMSLLLVTLDFEKVKELFLLNIITLILIIPTTYIKIKAIKQKLTFYKNLSKNIKTIKNQEEKTKVSNFIEQLKKSNSIN